MGKDHPKKKRYKNIEHPPRSIWGLFKWLATRQRSTWPKMVPNEPQGAPKTPQRDDELSVCFVNHSTALIQMQGKVILTDPVWSRIVGPFSIIGFKRRAEPGITFDQIPPVDLILLSHNHYDHMDLPTLKKLYKRDQPLIYVPRNNARYLTRRGIKNVTELDWWDSVNLDDDFSLTLVPAEHFSGRSLADHRKGLWGGYMMTGKHQRVFFAGDTAYGPHFKEVAERLGSPSLALLPIGAFKPEWFMHPIHMGPHEAVQAHLDLKSSQSLAIHYGTFALANDAFDEPVTLLRQALEQRQIDPDLFWILNNGESRIVRKV